MISPNVTTRAHDARSCAARNVGDDPLGVGAQRRVVAGGDRPSRRVSEVPTPTATAPARIQSPALSSVTPPVGISFTWGIGPRMSLM